MTWTRSGTTINVEKEKAGGRELVGSEKYSRSTTSEATFATSDYMSRRIETMESRINVFKPTKKLAIMFTSLSRTHSKFCWDATLSWPLLSLSLFDIQKITPQLQIARAHVCRWHECPHHHSFCHKSSRSTFQNGHPKAFRQIGKRNFRYHFGCLVGLVPRLRV